MKLSEFLFDLGRCVRDQGDVDVDPTLPIEPEYYRQAFLNLVKPREPVDGDRAEKAFQVFRALLLSATDELHFGAADSQSRSMIDALHAQVFDVGERRRRLVRAVEGAAFWYNQAGPYNDLAVPGSLDRERHQRWLEHHFGAANADPEGSLSATAINVLMRTARRVDSAFETIGRGHFVTEIVQLGRALHERRKRPSYTAARVAAVLSVRAGAFGDTDAERSYAAFRSSIRPAPARKKLERL